MSSVAMHCLGIWPSLVLKALLWEPRQNPAYSKKAPKGVFFFCSQRWAGFSAVDWVACYSIGIFSGEVIYALNMQDTLLSNEPDRSSDQVEAALLTISQVIIVGVFGLLPLFFLPISFLSVDYVKTIAVSVGVLLALIFYSLSILRSGKISIAAPWALWGLWGVVLAAIISSSLSGDMYDSFIGGSFGVHTTLFLFLLVLVVTSALLKENIAGALEQLRKVLELNPGNEDVITLIGQLESGEPLTAVSQESSAQQIAEPEAVTTNENTVITTQDPDTPLISPVNTVGEEQEDEEVSAS